MLLASVAHAYPYDFIPFHAGSNGSAVPETGDASHAWEPYGAPQPDPSIQIMLSGVTDASAAKAVCAGRNYTVTVNFPQPMRYVLIGRLAPAGSRPMTPPAPTAPPCRAVDPSQGPCPPLTTL